MKRLTIAAALLAATLAAPTPARAEVILFQNFDDITAMAGWTSTNNSNPAGQTWFQGNDGVFEAQSGAANSYIASNFLSAGAGGNISNWLILPELTLDRFNSFSFFTRSTGFYPDRLEVRFSANGGSGNVGSTDASVGDFTTLLFTLNPALGSEYPTDWTEFEVSLAALDGASGRLAFRYDVPDTNVNADYIGIDSVTVNHVPEPATLALTGLGLAGLIARRRRGSALSERMEA